MEPEILAIITIKTKIYKIARKLWLYITNKLFPPSIENNMKSINTTHIPS